MNYRNLGDLEMAKSMLFELIASIPPDTTAESETNLMKAIHSLLYAIDGQERHLSHFTKADN